MLPYTHIYAVHNSVVDNYMLCNCVKFKMYVYHPNHTPISSMIVNVLIKQVMVSRKHSEWSYD